MVNVYTKLEGLFTSLLRRGGREAVPSPIAAVRQLERRIEDFLAVTRHHYYKRELPAHLQGIDLHATLIMTAEFDSVESAVEKFAVQQTGKGPDDKQWATHDAFRKKHGRHIEDYWGKLEDQYRNSLSWIQLTRIYVEGISDIPDPTYINFSGGVHVGDNYSNNTNSTIITRSKVENAFNTLASDGNKEAAALIKQVAELVAKSEDPAAGALFDKVSEEAAQPTPDKGRLKSLWDGLVKVLPTLAELSSSIVKAFGLG